MTRNVQSYLPRIGNDAGAFFAQTVAKTDGSALERARPSCAGLRLLGVGGPPVRLRLRHAHPGCEEKS